MGRINSYKQYVVQSGASAYASLSVGGTAIALPTPPSKTNAASIVCVGNSASTDPVPLVNIMLNGETPTSSTGIPLYNGGVIEIFENELASAMVISADGATHVLRIEYARVY